MTRQIQSVETLAETLPAPTAEQLSQYVVNPHGLISTHGLLQCITLPSSTPSGKTDEQYAAEEAELKKAHSDALSASENTMKSLKQQLSGQRGKYWRAKAKSIFSKPAYGIERGSIQNSLDVMVSEIAGFKSSIRETRQEIVSLMSSQKKQEEKLSTERLDARIASIYPAIDASFLQQRRKTENVNAKGKGTARIEDSYGNVDYKKISFDVSAPRLPVFAVYSLENPFCNITAKYKRVYFKDNFLFKFKLGKKNKPSPASEYFNKKMALEDSVQITARTGDRNTVMTQYTVVLESRFNKGMIPDKTKAKIDAARQYFGDNIFIVAEADWKITYAVGQAAPDPEPLVIGISSTEKASLIDAFDCSPVESRTVQDYSGSKPGRN